MHYRRKLSWKPSNLILFLGLLFLAAIACDIEISATKTPYATMGETVFSILYWGTPDEMIDVVFAPDDDYGDMTVVANRQTFLDDVADLIDTGYWQNNGLAVNLHLFNFWYMTLTGDVQPSTDTCPTVTWPSLTDASFAEVIILVHPNPLRDCRWGNKATTEPGSYRTVVHESSHAIFNLPDEYPPDGGYWNMYPILYSSETDCNNDPANAAWRDCQQVGTTGWWRSEDNIICIMSSGGATVWEYGHADWVVVRSVLVSLPGASVNDPDVFAPDPWDWP